MVPLVAPYVNSFSLGTFRQDCPDTELEVFVHGALCIAYSGRCLLSGYFNHRDANQGSCTNSCRWDYKIQAGVDDVLAPLQAAERLRGYSESGRSLYVGDVTAFDAARGLAQVTVKNRFSVGDWLEIIQPSGNADVQLARMENADGQAIEVAPGSGHVVWLPLPATSVGAFVARYVQGSPPELAAMGPR